MRRKMNKTTAATTRVLKFEGSAMAMKLKIKSTRPNTTEIRAAFPVFSRRESRPNAKNPSRQNDPKPMRNTF
jgi:hypothetical protein